MKRRPIVGPDWRDFVEKVGQHLRTRTAPRTPTLPPNLADAFNTCSLCVFLASCAVADDQLYAMFRESQALGLTKEDLDNEVHILRSGPFPNIAALFHGDPERRIAEKVSHIISVFQTLVLAEKMLEPIAVDLIRARATLGGRITRAGCSEVTAHHLSTSFAHEVLRVACPDLIVCRGKGRDENKYVIPNEPRIYPVANSFPVMDFNELSDQMLTEACLAAENSSSSTRHSRSSRVELREPEKGPVVLGKIKSKLTTPQYHVVQALLDAGDEGLTKDMLIQLSGHEDAVNVLKRLSRKDPDWQKVIHLAGITGGGYRIK